jgi:hypothetical protein
MGHPCPECGVPRKPDNTPSCACSQRAADALREARAAQAAAAEDFDPLRIRPYVELDDGTANSAPPAADGAPPDARDETMPLRAVAPETPAPTDEAAALPTPLAPPATEPSATDLSLFETTGTVTAGTGAGVPGSALPDLGAVAPGAPDGTPAGRGSRRRRRSALLAVAGAVVAVVAAAGYASGLFSYETPSRDTALPEDVRAGVPDAPSTSPASGAPATSASPARPTSASPSPGGSPSPSPSPSASSASSSPSNTPEPTQTPTTSAATGSAQPSNETARQDDTADAVLRRGDRGPEVTELQLRLRQLDFYTGEANGNFNQQVEESLRNYQRSRGIQGDEPGVYGEETRTRLESETTEP